MKALTLETYQLFYLLTGSKVFSYYIAVCIVAALSVIVLMGLFLLLDGVVPTKSIMVAFTFPFSIGTWLVVALADLKIVPMSVMEVANHMKIRYLKLLTIVIVAVVILAYKTLLAMA